MFSFNYSILLWGLRARSLMNNISGVKELSHLKLFTNIGPNDLSDVLNCNVIILTKDCKSFLASNLSFMRYIQVNLDLSSIMVRKYL